MGKVRISRQFLISLLLEGSDCTFLKFSLVITDVTARMGKETLVSDMM